MKKNFLAILLFSFAIISVRADLIWYENFNYPDGQIILTSTNLDGSTNWFRHSGSGNDAFVMDHKEQISASSPGTLPRTDDINRPLATAPDSPYTNSQTTTYASFTVNCTNLPNGTGSYFAHFKDTTVSNFVGRVFALVGSSAVGGLPSDFTALSNTWRLGISAGSNSVDKVFPVDLALNTDYQVVIAYDAFSAFATLWVNPTSSTDLHFSTSDNISPTLQNVIQSAFAFRQGGSLGNFFCTISNLAVATSFEEAATNVWSTAPVRPVIAYQTKDTTNFVGSPTSLSVVANGQGLSSLLYQWRKGGGNIGNPGGNTNVYSIASPTTGNSGNYDVIVTTPYGLSVTSDVAFLWITNPPVPPSITQQPTNKTVYVQQTATFTVGVFGFDPHYQWIYNGNPATGPLVSGANTPTLTVSNVNFGNGTTGIYSCTITNIYGPTNTVDVTLSVTNAPLVTIGYLRSLVDPVFFLPTNLTDIYTVTGIVTTWTNITTAANTSFYVQDGTGGIDVFWGGVAGATFGQKAGDQVTVTGPLGQFNSLLELNLTSANPAHSVVINSSGNPLPAGAVLPFNFTNGVAVGGVGEAIRRYQGLVVTFTNVYFVNAGANFAVNANYLMTNAFGGGFVLRVDSRVGDFAGKPIPAFAWTVTGPMGFFLNTSVADRSAGYQFTPTRYADIVTTPPPAATGVITLSGSSPTLNWAAQPYMSYSIFRATNVEGPYVPLITGLSFNSTTGTYTDANTTPETRFYKILSP